MVCFRRMGMFLKNLFSLNGVNEMMARLFWSKWSLVNELCLVAISIVRRFWKTMLDMLDGMGASGHTLHLYLIPKSSSIMFSLSLFSSTILSRIFGNSCLDMLEFDLTSRLTWKYG